MSADNGIYIAKFPKAEGGFEWRVIHAQAIENCDDSPNYSQELTDAYRTVYFAGAESFDTEEAADAKARQMEAEVLADDFCPILEYGVCSFEFDRPLKLDIKAAEEFENRFWSDREKSK